MKSTSNMSCSDLPDGLVWDDDKKRCEWESSTCSHDASSKPLAAIDFPLSLHILSPLTPRLTCYDTGCPVLQHLPPSRCGSHDDLLLDVEVNPGPLVRIRASDVQIFGSGQVIPWSRPQSNYLVSINYGCWLII